MSTPDRILNVLRSNRLTEVEKVEKVLLLMDEQFERGYERGKRAAWALAPKPLEDQPWATS